MSLFSGCRKASPISIFHFWQSKYIIGTFPYLLQPKILFYVRQKNRFTTWKKTEDILKRIRESRMKRGALCCGKVSYLGHFILLSQGKEFFKRIWMLTGQGIWLWLFFLPILSCEKNGRFVLAALWAINSNKSIE